MVRFLNDVDAIHHEGELVKKLVLLVVAALGALLVFRRVQSTKAEQDLWAEATDPIKQ